MASAPQRLVSLVPSTTESICRLGAAARLVGCTRYCIEPAPQLMATARIGGTKNPDREAILALAPDLVLANAEENREQDLDWLASRVPVLVQTPRTVAEAVQDLRELATRLDVTNALEPFLRRIEAGLASAGIARQRRPRLRVYYAVWPKPWMTVNGDTFVHDVLHLVGATNVAADASARYPEISPMAAVANGVDVVLLPSEPWEFDAAQQEQLAREQQFGSARLVLCDGRDFCWHGVHMAEGLRRALALFTTAPD